MPDSFIRVPSDSSGKRVDAESLTVSTIEVYRQRIQVAGVAAADIAPVNATQGLAVDVTRVQGTVTTAISSAPTLSVQITSAPTLSVQITSAPTLTVEISRAATLSVQITSSVNLGVTSAATLSVQVTSAATLSVQITSANTLTVEISRAPTLSVQITSAPTLSVQITSSVNLGVTSAATLSVQITSAATLTVQISSANTLTVQANIATIPSAIMLSSRMVIGTVVDETANSLTVMTTFTSVSASGTNTVITGVANTKMRVLGYRLQNGGATTVTAQFASGSLFKSMPWVLDKREGITTGAPAGAFEFEGQSITGVTLVLGAAILTHVHVIYIPVT